MNNTDPLDSFLDAIQTLFSHDYSNLKEDYYLATQHWTGICQDVLEAIKCLTQWDTILQELISFSKELAINFNTQSQQLQEIEQSNNHLIKENNDLKIKSYDTMKRLSKALEEIGELKLSNESFQKRVEKQKELIEQKEGENKSLLLRISLYATQGKGVQDLAELPQDIESQIVKWNSALEDQIEHLQAKLINLSSETQSPELETLKGLFIELQNENRDLQNKIVEKDQWIMVEVQYSQRLEESKAALVFEKESAIVDLMSQLEVQKKKLEWLDEKFKTEL